MVAMGRPCAGGRVAVAAVAFATFSVHAVPTAHPPHRMHIDGSETVAISESASASSEPKSASASEPDSEPESACSEMVSE